VDTSCPAISWHFRTGHFELAAETGEVYPTAVSVRKSVCVFVRQLLGPHLDVGVVEEPIEERGHRGGVTQELAPVVDWAVRGQDRRGPFVATHDEVEEVLGRRVWELAHAQIIDDQQGHGSQLGEEGLALAVQSGVGDLFDEPVLATLQLVGDERGDQVEGRELLSLCVPQPGF